MNSSKNLHKPGPLMGYFLKSLTVIMLTGFFISFTGFKASAQTDLVLNSPMCFTDMDGQVGFDDDGLVNGVVHLHSLTLNPGGSISFHDPGSSCDGGVVGGQGAGAGKIDIRTTTFINIAGGTIDANNLIDGGNGGEIYLEAGTVFSMSGGLITSNNQSGTSGTLDGGNITINVTGNATVSNTSIIQSLSTNGTGGDISMTVGGQFSLLGIGGCGPGGSVIKSRGTGNGSGGGDITLHVTGDIFVDCSSSVDAGALNGRGGTIEIVGGNDILIDGQILSQTGGQSGSGCNPAHGGYITIKAARFLTISDTGVVSSKGNDPGADLVHLCGCKVYIYGLVESTGQGHAHPHCAIPTFLDFLRPEKPASTAGVEIWACDSLIIDNSGTHHGEVNADLTKGESNRSWIDLFCKKGIRIVSVGSNYAVHANVAGSGGRGGIVNVKCTEGGIYASGLFIQANSKGSDFRRGGDDTVHAKKNLTLDGATIQARGADQGGTIDLRSFDDNITIIPVTTLDVGGGGTNGDVTETACGTVDAATIIGSNPHSPTLGDCNNNDVLQPYVQFCCCACDHCITITKIVSPDCPATNIPSDWTFTSDIPGAGNDAFTIHGVDVNDPGSKTFCNLTPGTYHITETNIPEGAPDFWKAIIICNGCGISVDHNAHTATATIVIPDNAPCGSKDSVTFKNVNQSCQPPVCGWCNKSAVLSQVWQNPGGGVKTKENTCLTPDILVDVRMKHDSIQGNGSNTDVVDANEIGTGIPATWSIQAAVNYANAHIGEAAFVNNEIFIGVTASDPITVDPATDSCGNSCTRPPSGDNPYGTENVIVTNLSSVRMNIFGCSVTMHAKDVNLPVITVKDGVGKVTILDLHVWNSKVAGYLVNNNASLVVVKNGAAYNNALGYDARSGEIQLTGSQHVIGNDTGIVVRGNNVKLRSMHDITFNKVGILISGSGNTEATDGSEVGTHNHPNGLGILVTGNNNTLHGDDADWNTGNGIEVTGCGNTLDEESAESNGGTGIKVTCALNSNKLHGNDADNNGGNGIFACGQVNQGGNSGSGNGSVDVVFVCAGPVKFIVTDKSADKAFKYDNAFVLGSSSTLHANNKDAYDAADDGSKTYVVDKNFKVYSYVGATKTESPKVLKETGGTALKSPTGLAILSNDMWVADETNKKVYKYSLSAVFTGPAGNINAASQFAFVGANANAGGLLQLVISGVTYLYVLDDNDKQLYKYSTAGALLATSKVMKDNGGSSLGSPTGATTDGTTVWVVDGNKDKVYSYSLSALFAASGNLNATAAYPLDGGNGDATGIAIGAAANFPARSVDVQTADASDNLQSASLFVYPNPAHNNVTIQFMSVKDAKYSMNLVDQMGRTVMTDFIQAKQGLNTHELSLGKYARGMYLLILKNDNEKLQKKILVE